jgi:hypothetical protein
MRMGMFEHVSRRVRARTKITELDLNPAIAMAKKYFGLIDDEVEAAVRDYRHFLYLVYWNKREENTLQVVPTKHADKLWHGHLLFNKEYNRFFEELIGKILYHNPGLEEGTVPFLNAVAHTKMLHDRRAAGDGFHPNYFGHVSIKRVKGRKTQETTSSDGGGIVILIGTGDGDSDGASCGGGGCSGCGG